MPAFMDTDRIAAAWLDKLGRAAPLESYRVLVLVDHGDDRSADVCLSNEPTDRGDADPTNCFERVAYEVFDELLDGRGIDPERIRWHVLSPADHHFLPLCAIDELRPVATAVGSTGNGKAAFAAVGWRPSARAPEALSRARRIAVDALKATA